MSYMFSSINFLFLTSLAITSWVLLCYFKQIEDQRIQAINIDFAMGNCSIIERPYDGAGNAVCAHNYDMYLNFVCIFACIYALAKVTNLTESYIARHVHDRVRKDEKVEIDEEPKTFEDYRTKMQNMLVQMTYLEQKNATLERKLSDLQLRGVNIDMGNGTLGGFGHISNIGNIGNIGNMGKLTGELSLAETKTILQNWQRENNALSSDIYTTKCQFQTSQRRVFVNEGNVQLNFSATGEEGGDFTQIWQKYLELQQHAIERPPTTSITPNLANLDFSNPIVMTNVEIHSLAEPC